MIALTVGMLEIVSWIGILMLPAHRRARRTTEIYAEQSAMIRVLLDQSSPHHLEIHPVLGWRYAPNYKSKVDQMNAMALRSSREYALVPPANILRIAAFGDSFVYGSEVDNANAWPALLEAQDANMEVLNYGVGGYGVDQAYLRYLLEGIRMSPHVVLIGFSPDDISRTVNVYRRFLTDWDFVLIKPRYVFAVDGGLSLLEMPARLQDYQRLLAEPSSVRRFGAHDYWYVPCVYQNPLYDLFATVRLGCTLAVSAYRKYLDPERPIAGRFYNVDSPAFKIQAALFGKFSESVCRSGAVPLVLMLPDDRSIERVRRGERAIYEPLLVYMREHGIDYADAAEGFREADPGWTGGVKGWFAPEGHYSPSGNKIVAAWLAKAVRKTAEAQRGCCTHATAGR